LYEKGTEVIIPKYLLLSGGFLRSYGFDLVHFRRIRPFWGLLNFKRVVTSTDDPWASLKPRGLNNKFKRFYIKNTHWFFRNWLDLVITTSNSAKGSLIKYAGIPDHKINVIYNGVDFNIFKPIKNEVLNSFKKKFGIDYPFILHVSNYHPIKNPVILLRSYYKCKKLGIKHKLVIVGGRWEKSQIMEVIAKLELASDIKFFGYANQKLLCQFYNAADLFFLPSLKETFPSVILEALACGCPIVSSNTHGIPEAAGAAALLADNPGSSSQFSQLITQILSDDSLRTWLSKKALFRSKKFDWKQTARKTLEIYKKVLN
jgi:glycosyltransferase involved in cell wall biosynthesis